MNPLNNPSPAGAGADPTLALLREQALRHCASLAPQQRDALTALPYLSFIRFTQPTELNSGILEPSMCLVLQGRKKFLIGRQISDYGAGSYVLSALDMPVSGQVTEASPEAPYLGLRIALDAREIAALIVDTRMPLPRLGETRPAAYVDCADTLLQQALLRLLDMLERPQELAAIGHLLKQEILYRLLTSGRGALLYHAVTAAYQEKGISDAIEWIKRNYAQPFSIATLASAVSMSASHLHHRFKAITVMSPLQYQKRIRLMEARKLLLAGKLEAASVAFQVGYESPSQFSREYRRLFGASPLRDIEYLKHHEPAL